MRLKAFTLTPVAAALVLTGCVTTPTHDSKVAASLSVAKSGQIEEAIRQVDFIFSKVFSAFFCKLISRVVVNQLS